MRNQDFSLKHVLFLIGIKKALGLPRASKLQYY